MTVFSPSQDGLSAMILACVVTSCGESWGSSLGWVWTQPSGSISYKHAKQRDHKVEPFDNGYRTVTEKRGGCREVPLRGDRGYKIAAVIGRSIVSTLHSNRCISFIVSCENLIVHIEEMTYPRPYWMFNTTTTFQIQAFSVDAVKQKQKVDRNESSILVVTQMPVLKRASGW